MDPLVRINESVQKNELPSEIYEDLVAGANKARDAIAKIEKASGIKYPEWYIYPRAIAMGRPPSELSIIYSRFFPFSYEGALYTVVQVTPPLILYASKDTILAVLAHEMLHYVNFVASIRSFSVTSDETMTSVFESVFRDENQLYDPEKVFRRGRRIIRLLKEKFSMGLNDQNLNRRTIKKWFARNLPVEYIAPEDNAVRVNVSSLLSYTPEESLKRFLNWT
ncbi:MAG: hypothetical protein ACP5LW_04410 [Nitrososphaeria archaeon]